MRNTQRQIRNASAWLTLLALPGGLSGCGEQDGMAQPTTPAAATSQPARPMGVVYLEEDTAEFFVELSRSSLFGFTEVYTSIRLVAWRHVGSDRNEAKIRMGLGYGTALSAAAKQEMSAQATDPSGLNFFRAMMEEFNERTFFQLTAEDARSLIAFLDQVAAVTLRPAPGHVASRFVDARWGDFQVRKTDEGVFVWLSGDPGGWEPLPIDRLKAGLSRAIEDLARLTAEPPSADVGQK